MTAIRIPPRPTRRLSTLASLALAAAAILPGLSRAAVPDPSTSTIPGYVVGRPSGSPTTESVIIVRDVAAVPIPGATVELNFSLALLRPYTTQNAGVTLNCAQRTVSVVTDNQGVARISPRFGGCHTGLAIPIRADGVFLGTVRGRSPDLDGQGGRAGLGDFASFAAAYNSWIATGGPPSSCFDFDGQGCALCAFSIFAEDFLYGPTLTNCP
jgi:hypothetical protein